MQFEVWHLTKTAYFNSVHFWLEPHECEIVKVHIKVYFLHFKLIKLKNTNILVILKAFNYRINVLQ